MVKKSVIIAIIVVIIIIAAGVSYWYLTRPPAPAPPPTAPPPAKLKIPLTPFNDTYIRQALAWATPYEAIYEEVYRGFMRPYWGVIPYGMPGWTDYGIYKYTFNLTKAQEILKNSPWYYKNITFNITIMYNLGNLPRARTAALLQNTWGRLVNKWGKPLFIISTQALNWPTVLAKGETGDFDVWLIGWAPDYLDPDNYAGPMFYGATVFSELGWAKVDTAEEVANYIAAGKGKVIDTPNYYVVVGEKGTGYTPTQAGKPYIVVYYTVNWTATPTIEELMEAGLGFAYINPAFYRNIDADALILVGREQVTDPAIREAIYNAIHIISNHEVPIIWIGQYVPYRTRWTWLEIPYAHPIMPVRWDLEYEYSDAPVVETGIKGYVNDPETLVIATIGWPRSFDPAASYESFGWWIYWETGTTPITYWRNSTEPEKNGAVAWAFSLDGQWLYLVIRGGMKAYNQWDNVTYDITAKDVLFTIWRVARLRHSVSWMINAFIDVNASTWYTEEEFDNIIKTQGVTTSYHGKSTTIKEGGLSELLEFFNHDGPTAGVVALKLYTLYPAILSILADAFLKILPAQYVLGDNYTAAMEATNDGRYPANYSYYVGDYWKTDWTHAKLHTHPVSTGPYYLKEYVEDQYMVFEYNPYYWNASLWYDLYKFNATTGEYEIPNPTIRFHKRVIIIIANEWATRKELLRTGTADSVYVPAENIPEVNGTVFEGTNYYIEIKPLEVPEYTIYFAVLNTYPRFPEETVKVKYTVEEPPVRIPVSFEVLPMIPFALIGVRKRKKK